MTDWSSRISFPRPHHDIRAQLVELLHQDGMGDREIDVPALGSEGFLQLIKDAESFSTESGLGESVCPLRAGRWLNRISVAITKRRFVELPPTARQAIAHAALLLGGHPELLR